MGFSVRDLSVLLFPAERAETAHKLIASGTGDSWSDRASRFLSGRSQQEHLRTNINVLTICADSFGGNILELKAFIGRLAGGVLSKSSIGALDFNALVQSGVARKLVDLERAHPKAFTAALSGSYGDIGSLNTALDKIARTANAEAPLGKGRVTQLTIPADKAGTPNDLSCSVTRRGGMSCDWDKAQAQAAHLEQEAAHFLKAGAELIESASHALSPVSQQSPKLK